MSNPFLKIKDQNQIDLILMEAYPACFHLKNKYGEEFLIDFLNAFGGVEFEVPTIEELKELTKIYFDQEYFKNLEKKKTFKSAISSLNSNNLVKSPSELKSKVKKMSQHFKADQKSFFDFYYEVLQEE